MHFAYINHMNLNDSYTYPPNCWCENGTSQGCSSDEDKWSFWDWLFTSKPTCFGLIAGAANPTGIFLYMALLIIVFASLPFVRRSGKFEVKRFLSCLL